jgi:hypothetical protein
MISNDAVEETSLQKPASLNNGGSIANETELNIISINDAVEETSLQNMEQIISYPIKSNEMELNINQSADYESLINDYYFDEEDNDETLNMIMDEIEKLPSTIENIDEAMEQRKKFNEIAHSFVVTQYKMKSTNEIGSSMQTDLNRNESFTSEDMDVHINSYLNLNYITQLIKKKNYDSIKTYILLYILTFINKILDDKSPFVNQFNQIKDVLETLKKKLYEKIALACRKFFSNTKYINNKTTNDSQLIIPLSQTLLSPKRKDAKRTNETEFNESQKNKKVVKRLVENITDVLNAVSSEYSNKDNNQSSSPFAVTERIKEKFKSSYRQYGNDTKKINDALIFNLSQIAMREAEKENPLFPVIFNEKNGTEEKEKVIADIFGDDSDEGRTRKRKSTYQTLYEISYKNTSTSSKRKKSKKETKTLKTVRSTVSIRDDSVYCFERFSKGILFIDFAAEIEQYIGGNYYDNNGKNKQPFIDLLNEQFLLQEGQFYDSKFFSVVLDIAPNKKKKAIAGRESIVFKNYLAFDSIEESKTGGHLKIEESTHFLDAFIKDDTEYHYQLLDDLPIIFNDYGERYLNRKKVMFYTFEEIISNFNRIPDESPTVIFNKDNILILPITNSSICSEIKECFKKLLHNLIGNSLMNLNFVAIEKEVELENEDELDSTINNNNNDNNNNNNNNNNNSIDINNSSDNNVINLDEFIIYPGEEKYAQLIEMLKNQKEGKLIKIV